MQSKKIGTHSGNFHADEALACAMLVNFTQTYKNAQVIRTRDQEILNQMDIVVDVGGKYEPENNLFDHHQNTFSTTFSDDFNIKLSGAGLVYKHFGKEIVQNIINETLDKYEGLLTVEIDRKNEDMLEKIYQKVYKSFILSVDGIDNGVDSVPKETEFNYRVNTDYSSRVGKLNPVWCLKNQDFDANFKIAMQMAREELVSQVESCLLNWYPGRPLVLKAVENRFQVHESGQIIKFEQFCPFGSHLSDIEQEQNLGDQIKFAIFPENEKSWRIKAINLKDSYDLRVGLKKEWRGIKDMRKLKEISKIDDIVFVHVSGFIGGARSYDSVMKMAVESLQADQQEKEQKKE